MPGRNSHLPVTCDRISISARERTVQRVEAASALTLCRFFGCGEGITCLIQKGKKEDASKHTPFASVPGLFSN